MKFHRLVLFALCVGLLNGALLCAQENAAPQGRVFVNFASASQRRCFTRTLCAGAIHLSVCMTLTTSTPISPLAEELIPTQLHFSLPGEVAIGKMQYPAGKLMSFPFDPNTKLSVYSGDFVVRGVVVAPTQSSTGTYTIHGELRYQACDNNACYPPKKLPFTFNVTVGSPRQGRAQGAPKGDQPAYS